MSDVFLLSERQMERIEPFFPLAHGVPRVDDRRVLSGIVYVIRNGLQWKDAPKAYGPHKTLYNRFIRWSRLGVFDRIFTTLADLPAETKEVIGDRGYDSDTIRQSLTERNITVCIPTKKNRKFKPPYDWHLYKKRHLIENMFDHQIGQRFAVNQNDALAQMAYEVHRWGAEG
ncbi:transposase [Acetobacter thailandicus]|uniref:transposase n=1 Tax=Acetobacter thailandicus TaxID=1502842 RepID=UPI0038D142A7